MCDDSSVRLVESRAVESSAPHRPSENNVRGVAQSGLARFLGVQEVAGSNPVAPIFLGTSPSATTSKGYLIRVLGSFRRHAESNPRRTAEEDLCSHAVTRLASSVLRFERI